MSRAIGLLRRNGVYYLNLRVPKELIPFYEGRQFIRKSLRTSDYRLACRKAQRAKLMIDEGVVAKREGKEGRADELQMPLIGLDEGAEDTRLQMIVPTPSMTMGGLADLYMKEMTESNSRKESTVRTYRTIVRVVKELLGEVPVESFTYERAREFLQSLLLLPPNLKQRFPTKSVREVIEESERSGDFERVSKKTLENYLTNFSAILNFGVRRDFIRKNPLSDKFVREVITRIPESPKEAIFYTIEELNRLFRAPLYTGCLNDENGVNRSGPNRPRRGRFWMPLLALYHGFRLNEVAQLNTEDVKCEEGIWHIFVRPETDDAALSGLKQVKTEQSRRRVPIHPELHRMGFLEYVEKRRKDSANPLLFTDSASGSSGYYSDIASKRYSVVRKAAIPDSLGTFHTFRHMFRDALREAKVDNVEIVEALGGWEVGGSRSAQGRYGKGPSLVRLYEEISKVRYEGLDLSHLYAEKN